MSWKCSSMSSKENFLKLPFDVRRHHGEDNFLSSVLFVTFRLNAIFKNRCTKYFLNINISICDQALKAIYFYSSQILTQSYEIYWFFRARHNIRLKWAKINRSIYNKRAGVDLDKPSLTLFATEYNSHTQVNIFVR